MHANVSLYLDKRHKKQNNKFPVKLRVYYGTKTRFYLIGRDLTEDEYRKAYLSLKPRKEFQELRLALLTIENKAANIVNDLDTFSFDSFERKWLRGAANDNNVFYYYERYIESLNKQDRASTANNYDFSMKSLQKYLKEKGSAVNVLTFSEITPSFLNEYERWMQMDGKELTTVGIYIRPLRAIFNIAKAEGDIPPELYPFGKSKYRIPAGRNIKKALDKDTLRKLFSFKAANIFQEKARAFWFFSYQCNGMNIRDIAELKYANIQGDKIVFTRKKTINTTKTNLKPIIVPLTEYSNNVIKKYGNSKITKDTYIFPVLADKLTAIERYKRVNNFTRFINQHIKILAEAAGINNEISSYWARHSFTTNAIRSGASMEFIQESLGHQDIKTTMNYWGGFEDSVKRDIAEKIMDFV